MISHFVRFIYKKIVPVSFRRNFHHLLSASQYHSQQRRHAKTLRKYQNKKVLNVAFFALHDAVWKYESLYNLMLHDEKFNPIIVVCPVSNYGFENMIHQMNETYSTFKQKQYNVIKSYNEKTNKFLDIRKSINPDIIFYTNPYEGLINDRYYITKFSDKLTCYLPYGFTNLNVEWNTNLPLHNLVWIFFGESELNKKDVVKTQDIKGGNYVISGYPIYDELIKSKKDVWKTKGNDLKRIIWAPHHTITGQEGLEFSNFLSLYDFFFELLKEYEDKIQVCFKPHPLLRNKLYNHPDWGKENTDKYYEKWSKHKNAFIEDSYYIDLFTSSDAMIHDCGSFTIEYLFLWEKPVFYVSDGSRLNLSNEIATLAFNSHYVGNKKDDIRNFITEIVIGGNDPMKGTRYSFFKENLLPPNNKTASENMLDTIKEKLNDNR